MTKPSEAPYCTTREAARQLGVSLRTIQLWVENGQLDAWKTGGGHRRISRASITRLVQSEGNIAQAAAPSTRGPELDRIKVLVVEDDNILSKLYKAAIASWNLPIETITAKNGIEGLIRVGRDAPDLMITDLTMPGMDGFQLINNLSASSFREGMEIIVVTGMEPASIARQGGLPEDIRILSKPVPFTTLHTICTGLLERRSAYLQATPLTSKEMS